MIRNGQRFVLRSELEIDIESIQRKARPRGRAFLFYSARRRMTNHQPIIATANTRPKPINTSPA